MLDFYEKDDNNYCSNPVGYVPTLAHRPSGLWASIFMYKLSQVTAFIDGFNLYHSLVDLGPENNHLKWLNLWTLSQRYACMEGQKLTRVLYFSAYATWLPGPYYRHRAFVKALQTQSVEFVPGRFKEKERSCKNCCKTWIGHEEKETDVNIAIHMLDEAYLDTFDHALLFSADSDLSPVVRILKTRFPKKQIFIITPPRYEHSKELIKASGGYNFSRKIKVSHLENCLLPATLSGKDGTLIQRPPEYNPPQNNS